VDQTHRLHDSAHRPLRDGEEYKPYVPAHATPPEFTVKALFFGVLFGVLFGAANAYLGLRAGLTISTSIPVAVMTVAAFHALRKLGGSAHILEANMAQTVGSSSSSVASGVIFTLPADIARIAYWNKREVYGLLFRTSAETVMTIAADPKRLGARVGITSVLHTWGSALTHHPHIHMIVPGGGLSPDGTQWVSCRPGFFLPIRVLSRLFRRLFLEGLLALHGAGKLTFFGDLARLADAKAFAAWLAPLRKSEWVVYAKPPFGGPDAVLTYLSRYTHRVAISNHRLVSADARTVTFRWKDYRIKNRDRQKVMALETGEFIRRFLMHVLPDRFHRIRHYGFLAGAGRKQNVAQIRALLGAAMPAQPEEDEYPTPPLSLKQPCPDCGGRMYIIETFQRGELPRSRAPPHRTAA